jgi:CarD family transcriptional regulator
MKNATNNNRPPRMALPLAFKDRSSWKAAPHAATTSHAEGQMKFQIGDKVIHSAHGFAEIINLESKEVAGTSLNYYVVQTHDLRLWIPVENGQKDSLRLPTAKNGFDALFSILRAHYEPFSENRMERKTQIHARINEGNSESICGLIRDLSFYRKNKKLNEYESLIYERAVRVLIDEWQYSLSIPPVQASKELNVLLDESFARSQK